MLRLVSDEDVPGDIIRGLRQRQPALEIVRVQEVGLMQTSDADVLEWAAGEDRQVVTRDRNTMTADAWDRVRSGQPMLGVFVVPEHMPIGQAVLELELIALASESPDWHDRVIFLPL
jgi:hypothetical protein